ncbi:lysophospholipase [Schaalia sp. ZJ405]|uniref:GDSL-type esterase/lipase family protein n=1 Tax=Schaalia sp. ZJ405 TaxID=2709403 RepID=UPI0013EADA09|nr:GDSL-type esterase/lipase family protein [Schaalia sp. ZJ405]QPK80724.1 lysophospholipase [Schaalia sp. ZJ405]
MRICIIGDELVAGTGDPRGLGWVGRVSAHSEFATPPTILTLAMPGETTREMASRWQHEVSPRLPADEPRGLVIAVGPADVTGGVSSSRSRLNIANITDQASNLGIPCFVVGPPPIAGVDQQSLKTLSQSCAQVCERRSIPFVDTYAPLISHDQWFEDMAASRARSGDGYTLPGQSGYALLAWLVLHQGWYEWTGSQPST